MENHYATLGVAENATQDEIKKAYRKMAMELHPDRNPGNAAAEEQFKKVSAAYAEIGDADARANYDQQRQFRGGGGGNPFGQHGFSFNFGFGPGNGTIDEMLNQMFSQHGFGHPQPPRNRDLSFNMNLTLEEAFSGKQTPIQFNISGQTINLTVSIPAGVEGGTRIRYQGHGDRSVHGAPPGDLYIQVSIQDHARFKRSGPHLHTEIEINAFEAVLGCTKDLVCIDGQTVQITIPEGSQHGSTLRIRERGMPLRPSGTPRGDCLVEIKVKVPTAISSEDKLVLQEMLAKYNA